MRAKVFVLFLIVFSVFGCNKPDPHPWMKDPVYLDMQKEKKDLEAKVLAQVDQVKMMEDMYKKSVLQTGQARSARQKLEAQKNVLVKIEQQLRQHKYRIESRVEHTQREYLKAFTEKKPWPPAEEVDEYRSQENLSKRSRNWSVAERMKETRIPASIEKKH